MPQKRVLVVGGGIAGLAAAVRLADAGVAVRLLEKRAILGGRAYSYRAREAGHLVDNGQHLLMGCYDATLAFLERIGAAGEVERLPLSVPIADAEGRTAAFECAALPAPLHLLIGAMGFEHLPRVERAMLLAAGGRFVFRHLRGALGRETVAETLASLGQGARARRVFWDPLAIAVLNERPEEAASSLFGEVLLRVFTARAGASDLVFPRNGLSELFAEPARRTIEAAGGSVEIGCPVKEIAFSGKWAVGARLVGGRTAEADAIVVAVPPPALGGLLPDGVRVDPFFGNAARLRPAPIVSVHLWIAEPVATPRMLALLDGPIQWLFTPPMQPLGARYVTLVASGAHDLSALSPDAILAEGRVALARSFPEAVRVPWADTLVVKERSATFAASPAEQAWRPGPDTPIPNLWLAGDWTATGLPATIESAVVSGNRAAARGRSYLFHLSSPATR